jgi:hypothetical protein
MGPTFFFTPRLFVISSINLTCLVNFFDLSLNNVGLSLQFFDLSIKNCKHARCDDTPNYEYWERTSTTFDSF